MFVKGILGVIDGFFRNALPECVSKTTKRRLHWLEKERGKDFTGGTVRDPRPAVAAMIE